MNNDQLANTAEQELHYLGPDLGGGGGAFEKRSAQMSGLTVWRASGAIPREMRKVAKAPGVRAL